jgi:hypothetical protein
MDINLQTEKNPAWSAKEKSPRSGGLFLTITNIHTPRAARARWMSNIDPWMSKFNHLWVVFPHFFMY